MKRKLKITIEIDGGLFMGNPYNVINDSMMHVFKAFKGHKFKLESTHSEPNSETDTITQSVHITQKIIS